MSISASDLSTASDNCPHAIDLGRSGCDLDPQIVGTGNALHECHDAIYRGKDLDKVCADLRTIGKPRGGPPIQSWAVADGRALAERYHRAHPIPKGGETEVPAAFKSGWVPCDYEDPDRMTRMRADIEYTTTDIDDEQLDLVQVAVTKDLKSSWAVGPQDLRKDKSLCYLVSTWVRNPDADIIRHGIAAVRRNMDIVEDFRTTGRDLDLLKGFADRLETRIHELEQGPRNPRPGGGCLTCAYALACEPRREYVERNGLPTDRETAVRAYLASKAVTGRLETLCKVIAADLPPDLPFVVGAHSVGFEQTNSRTVKPGATAQVIGDYLTRLGVEVTSEVAAGIERMTEGAEAGVTTLEKIARKMHKERADAAEYLDRKTTIEHGRKWAVKKDGKQAARTAIAFRIIPSTGGDDSVAYVEQAPVAEIGDTDNDLQPVDLSWLPTE